MKRNFDRFLMFSGMVMLAYGLSHLFPEDKQSAVYYMTFGIAIIIWSLLDFFSISKYEGKK